MIFEVELMIYLLVDGTGFRANKVPSVSTRTVWNRLFVISRGTGVSNQIYAYSTVPSFTSLGL